AYKVTVTLHHEAAPDAVVTDNAAVSDPAVAATGNFTISAVEGAAFSGATVATFTDPAGAEPNAFDGGPISDHYGASIDWGDGTATSAGTITYDSNTGVFTVKGGHTYFEEGAYTVTVTLTHELSAPQKVTSAA